MPVDHKLLRCAEADDPHRCKAAGGEGQCPYYAVDGSDFCSRHGGNKAIEKAEKESIRNYRLAKWQARLNEFADNPQVKSLREEIGVLRICLEETMNRAKDAEELFMMSNKISDLVMKIEKVVGSCNRLEQATGQTLDKTAALNFASQILEIIGRHIPSPEIIDLITSDILESLKSLSPTGA